jgi:eukaryotic-like serine/threonine-protein kinase
LLDHVVDSAYPFGMFGFIVANVDAVSPHMHFDNLKIWSSDPPGQEVGLSRGPRDPTILIGGGEFIMGSNESGSTPPHLVTVKSFRIDRTEVTNAAYQQCVAAGKCTVPQSVASVSHPTYYNQAEFANYPVINVTWQQARDFCTSAGKQLPTEAEWERAAGWNSATHEKMVWPWSNTFDPKLLKWSSSFDPKLLNSQEANRGDTSAVDAFPPELNGTQGMAGNVSEWTSSLFKPYPYVEGDGREDPAAAGKRVFRGGSWAQTQDKACVFFRQGTAPSSWSREIGFRCVATP